MRIDTMAPQDLDRLLSVGPGLFDHPIRPDQARAFPDNPLNLLVMAWHGDTAVGMAPATILLHPDKPPSLFVNELGIHEDHLRQGVATALMTRLIELAQARGCKGIWLGTEPENAAARALYLELGGVEETFVGFSWDEAF